MASYGHLGPLMRILDTPNGCFMRWSLSAALLLISVVFMGLIRGQMVRISDRGGVKLTGSEKTSRNFLMVYMIYLISALVLAIYKALDCYM
jgi:hypothetical protein